MADDATMIATPCQDSWVGDILYSALTLNAVAMVNSTDGLSLQELALQAIYRDTGLALSPNGTNWLSPGVSPCQYAGITCYQDGVRLRDLIPAGLDLSGYLPTEIGWLTDLKRVDVSRNDLKGSLPTELALLSNLEHLEVYRNEMTGVLPSAHWPFLRRLMLQTNHFHGTLPTEICNLASLQVLDISNNNNIVGSIPFCLRIMQPDLHSLWIKNTGLSGMIPAHLCDGQLNQQGTDQSGMSSTASCDSIACPVGTFHPLAGRQVSTEDFCLPCPSSMTLGATKCGDELPEGTVTFSPSQSPIQDSTRSPTLSPKTAEPTALSEHPSVLMIKSYSPTPFSVTEQPTSLAPTLMPSKLFRTGEPTLQSETPTTMRPTIVPFAAETNTPEVTTLSPSFSWPPLPTSIAPTQSSDSSTSRAASINWLLISTGVAVLVFAFLAIVLVRRIPDNEEEDGSMTPQMSRRRGHRRRDRNRPGTTLASQIMGHGASDFYHYRGDEDDDEDQISMESESGWSSSVASGGLGISSLPTTLPHWNGHHEEDDEDDEEDWAYYLPSHMTRTF